MHCKYLPLSPYKPLEKFSKALYGTKGGTYSARIFRPVMESLNRFKLDSTRFQQAFNIFYVFNNVERAVQTHRTFGSTKCWMQVEANVETV